ncbi:Tetratricopeptide repeat protein 17 [Aphelenchoides fujianensis]|nr:Tetratricopeptide repeat protein 17 [Aphelenchoides fujianensis]
MITITPAGSEELFVQGGRFGESQSLRESHSLDAVLQREEWRDELVALSVSATFPESSQQTADAPKNDICDVYESYDHTTLAELFLSIQSATTNVHARPFEGVKQGDLKELLRIASPAVVKVAEMNGAYCSAYDVDGLQYEDLELANILKFAHRPRVPTDLDTGLLREIVAVGLPLGRQPARILQLAALFWWAEGSAAESAHCLQRMVLLAESEEQRRDAQFMLAQTFAFCDLFDLAIETFELVAETEPPLPTPLFFLGGLRAFTGDYEGALRDFEQAAALLKKPLDGHRLMGVKFCKCKLRELKRLKAEQESLEKELEELNAFNSAMERKLQLELLIQQKSSRERELINGFLAYSFLKHGPTDGIRCGGRRTEQGRQQLSCRIVNPLEFVKAGLRVHNDYQRGLGDLSAHDEFFRTYERHRNAQEEEYAAAMIPFLKEVEPYVGLRMDEPPVSPKYPKQKELVYERNIEKLCAGRSPAATLKNSTPIAIDLTTRGFPVGDLLNKYLGLTPDRQHPFPWEMPYCRPFDPTAEKSGLWAALKSPQILWKNTELYTAELDLLPVLARLMDVPPDGDFLLPDFGQRVLTLMKFVSSTFARSFLFRLQEIGPRWLLNEMATMFFRSLGLLQEALACVAENLNGTEPVHSPHVDLALFQLARILHHARPVEGTADDVVFLMKMATLNRHTDDPAVHLLAAVTAKTPEQSLAYLWKAHAIDPDYEPALSRLRESYCDRQLLLGPPIQNRFLPICCWKTEHDVFCFKRPEQEGACFKIETNVLDDERIEHKFRSFRCSGKYVPKSYLPPPIARFVVGFLRPALRLREKLIEEEVGRFLQEHSEKERKLEKERSKRVLPLDYGGFSHARIAYFSRTDAIEQLRSRVDEFVDPEVAAKRKEAPVDERAAEGDGREEEPMRTWDGEIVELDDKETPPPAIELSAALWHEVVQFDSPLPKNLLRPQSRLYERGLKSFKVAEMNGLEDFCSHTKLRPLIQPVSTFVSMSAKGFDISSVIDLKSPISSVSLADGEPICPQSALDAVPLFDRMAAYKHRHQFFFYQPEKGLRDSLLTLATPQDSVRTIGARLSTAIKKAASSKSKRPSMVINIPRSADLHWGISTLAALYWRVEGNAVNAINCLRHSLATAPDEMKDIAALSIGNVYHQAGFLNSALIAADYAFRASGGQVVAVHFTLANIYLSLASEEMKIEAND